VTKEPELYRRYRPKSLKGVVGQDPAVKVVARMLKTGWHHAVLLSGPSGTGKTTIARIVRRNIGCGEADYSEVDCASVSPLEKIRKIQDTMRAAPISGTTKMWVLDEVQALSRAKFAQQALLKMLEDPPDHAFFVLCTTDPGKLIPTVRNRATEIKLLPVGPRELAALVAKVAAAEGEEVNGEVAEKIVEHAEGSPRMALNLLGKVVGQPEKDALEIIDRETASQTHVVIGRLLFDPRSRWADVRAALREVQDDAESLRPQILGYANAILLNPNNGPAKTKTALLVIESFRDNFIDGGRAALNASCYQVLAAQKRA
jgi:DNA polymerase-3 subunit gamma/tau